MKRIMITSLVFVMLIAACAPKATMLMPSSTMTTLQNSTIEPTKLPEPSIPGPASIMLEEDFETNESVAAFPSEGEWTINEDSNGNHVYCNTVSTDWSHFRFGSIAWQNYAVEMNIEFIGGNSDQSAEVYSRINTGYEGYRSSLGLGWGGISFYPPPQSLSNFSQDIRSDTWYRLKVETYGSQIRFFIDDKLMTQANDTQRLEGFAGFGVSPNTTACVDEIKVWALTETGEIGEGPITMHPNLELVTDQAATGDGGNQWGGHQTRIVHTADGVFTTYTVEGGGHLAREWHLDWRQSDGTWLMIAQGGAGREPVNLLASPDGTLHIIGFPNGMATIFSVKLKDGQWGITQETIPGVSSSTNPYWPYNSAGIDLEGNLCVLASVGGETPGGKFQVACYLSILDQWATEDVPLDYRYCYTYIFPAPGGKLSLVSTRDVLWSALGYSQPQDAFEYVFNAVGVWNTKDFSTQPLQRVFFAEETPSDTYPFVYRNATEDAYIDTAGNLHILYHLQGQTTLGVNENRHAVLSPSGEILADVELPGSLGEFVRILQNTNGDFYLMGSSGLLYPAGEDGVDLGTPIIIDLQGYVVEHTGFGITSPRTGTPVSNIVDVVFPSGDGTQWVYFQLSLPNE